MVEEVGSAAVPWQFSGDKDGKEADQQGKMKGWKHKQSGSQ